jgi:transcriptional regulator with XRE-family HTH domain
MAVNNIRTSTLGLDPEKTGKRIEALRKERGLSVHDLQVYLGLEYPQAIYKWQWGESIPTTDNLFRLSRLFQVHMEDILVSTGEDVPFFTEEPAPKEKLPKRASARENVHDVQESEELLRAQTDGESSVWKADDLFAAVGSGEET